MAKLTNIRERVHQPFRDTLIRSSGWEQGNIQDRTDLFTQAGKSDGATNLKNGSTLPSDQSMVVLALRVFVWFRHAEVRGPAVTVAGGVNYPAINGDWGRQAGLPTGESWTAAQSNLANGSAPGSLEDVHRLYWQAEEQLLWSFGTGEKYSLSSMPTAYFPYGGGLAGELGFGTVPAFVDGRRVDIPDLILWNNGTPDHGGILRLARAVLLPPRQNVRCSAQIVALSTPNSATFGTTQGTRDMLSLTSNLNACDGIGKVISFTFDGLFSRDVQ